MRIGIYRSCGIGDAVQLTPLFRQIRADAPDAEIVFFTSENVAVILEGCPFLTRTIFFPTRLLTGAAADWGGFPLWRKISRHGRWDIFLDLEPHWRRSACFPLVRAARKGGVQTAGWKPLRLFDEFLVQHPLGLDRGHASARCLQLWEKLTGHPDRGFGYDLDFLREPPCALPPLPAGFVCLVPGAGNAMNAGDEKRWPLENWLRLAEFLTGLGHSPVWLGSAEDARQFPVGGGARNFMGLLDLRQVFQTISRSTALIANDSGLLHVALASGVKAVGLFGPTNPQRTGPFRNPNALILKAGFGRVANALLAVHDAGTDQDALDASMPMQQLGCDLVAREVAQFLTAPRANP